jgi:carbon-monoxide dehydrogenase large subunit
VKLIQDLGAYHQLLTPAIPTLSVLMLPGLYRCKTMSADIIGVFTNCVPTDAYRGAGRPEATHGIERMIDILAAELKMDPAEIRLKNFIRNEEGDGDRQLHRASQAAGRGSRAGPLHGHRHLHLR